MSQSLALSVIGSYVDSVSGITEGKTWSKSTTITGNTPISFVQNITTGDTTIYLGDMLGLTPGYVFLRNLAGVTPNIIVGADGTNYPAQIPGNLGFGVIAWNATAMHAKTTQGSAKLEVLIIPV